MACKNCKKNPVYKLPNKTLCKNCFIKYFENKVFKTIKKYNMIDFNDKLIVATSGGKDSMSVLYLVHKYLALKKLEKNITAVVVDEGIKEYRENTIKQLKKITKELNIKLEIITFKEKFGKTIDECVKLLENTNMSACNVCGTLRRYILNITAKELNGDKLITGHNIDDESQNIMLNIFKNNFNILTRLGPNNGVITDDKFIPRIKPLYFLSEKETKLYTILKGFNISYDRCPYSQKSLRNKIGEMINNFDSEIGGVKSSIVKFHLENLPEFKKKFLNNTTENITYCTKCKEPSQKEICNTCLILEKIN